MTVRAILEEKGRAVATLKPPQAVSEAVDLLAAKKIGAVVVVGDDGILAGILSERDIVRVMASKGADVLGTPIAEIMTSKVITCREDQTIPRVMGLMTEGRFRHLPVVDEAGKLSGIISIGDVVRRRIEDAEREADEVKAYLAM